MIAYKIAEQFLVLILLIVLSEAQLFSETKQNPSNENLIVSSIVILGNEVTKALIIRRELTFSERDTFTRTIFEEELKKSRENLLNTLLFNYVTIEYSSSYAKQTIVTIVVEERWFLWPGLLYNFADRNFNAWWRTKDFSRLSYGLELIRFNFRGMNEVLKLRAMLGFSKMIGLQYRDVYLDRANRHSLKFDLRYTYQNEISYKTENDKPIFYKSSNQNVYEAYSSQVDYQYRREYDNWHIFSLLYNKITIADTIKALNKNFLGENKQQRSFLRLQYLFVHDSRDSKSYAYNGFFLQTSMQSFVYDFSLNNTNTLSINLNFHQYYSLTKKIYSSSILKVEKRLFGEQVFAFNKALGYDDYVRGFEHYVINGSDYLCVNQSFKYEIIPTQVHTLDFIPIRQFRKIHYSACTGLFFDVGYVYNSKSAADSRLSNRPIYSVGAFFDFITYYDRIARIEYSFNSLREFGLYLHFEILL